LFLSVVHAFEDQIVMTQESFADKSASIMQLYPDMVELHWTPRVEANERRGYDAMQEVVVPAWYG
jgi:hypothetical protein